MRCNKTIKNSIRISSAPTGCLFSPSFCNPPPCTHARTHAHSISASPLSIFLLHHTSIRGVAKKKKWLSFKRPTQRSEITRLSLRSAVCCLHRQLLVRAEKFQHTAEEFSIHITIHMHSFSPFYLFACRKKKRVSGKHLCA